MFKKSCILGIILVLAVYIIKCVVVGFSHLDLVEFKPAAVIFLLDTSASNRSLQSRQEKTIVRICKSLDAEDKVHIYVVTEDTYLIYDQKPHAGGAIKKAFAEHAQYDAKSYGTAYGLALKKAVDDALKMKSEGYRPSIVVLGDLENEGAIQKQINWDKLPINMEKTLKYIPDLSIAFLYAHPTKLDIVRTKLKDVFPVQQLFCASEENVDLTVRSFMKSIH